MGTVNFYIPSESQVLLDLETFYVKSITYRFCIETIDSALHLRISSNTDTKTERIPDSMLQKIHDLAQHNKLTHAAVDQMLIPIKKKLIMQLPAEKMMNLSRLFASANGYAWKDGKPAMLFAKGSLQLDMFHDISSLCFTVSFQNTDHVIVLTSEEHILREREQIIFLMFADNIIYRATAIAENKSFYLQTITEIPMDQYQSLFQQNLSLIEIYRHFTYKKNRLLQR